MCQRAPAPAENWVTAQTGFGNVTALAQGSRSFCASLKTNEWSGIGTEYAEITSAGRGFSLLKCCSRG